MPEAEKAERKRKTKEPRYRYEEPGREYIEDETDASGTVQSSRYKRAGRKKKK